MSGSAMRKMAVYLGLVEDQGRYDEYADGEYDEYSEYSDDGAQTHETEHRAAAPAAPSGGGSVSTLTERRPVAPRQAEISQITTLRPRTYNEARTLGESFRDGIPVIMNLDEMDPDDAKRLVDFAAGLVFGLQGTIERISAKVFLLSPANVAVAAEDKARMASGFFNQS